MSLFDLSQFTLMSLLIRFLPHPDPPLVSLHEIIHPGLLENRQCTPWPLRLSRQLTKLLKVLLEFRMKHQEPRPVALLGDPLAFPLTLLVQRGQLRLSGEDTSCGHGLPFEDFEGQSGTDLDFKLVLLIRLHVL